MPHLTSDLYRLVIAGELSPGTLSRALHRHLLEVCPDCTREWRGAAPRLAEAAERPASDGQEVLGEAQARALARMAREVRLARRWAKRDLARLLSAPPERWREIVSQARTHFRSRATVELVVEHGRDLARSDPRLAERLLEFVPELLLWVPGGFETAWARQLAVRAEARRANALRAAGDLAAADRLFRLVRRDLAATPSADRTLYAEVASLEASLRRDERHYDEAIVLLDRAVLLYNEGGATNELARTLIKRADAMQYSGLHESALEDLVRARSLLDPDEHTFLYLFTVTGAVPTLLDLGRATEADHLLSEAEEAFAAVIDPWWALRFRYLQGRAAHALGQHDRALRLLGEARQGFVEQKLPYDVAAVSLELALLHLDRGDAARAERLTRQIAPVFRAVGVEREALATLRVFQQATAEEAREHLAVLRRCLAAAQAERGRRPSAR